jgi:hypothetical protein
LSEMGFLRSQVGIPQKKQKSGNNTWLLPLFCFPPQMGLCLRPLELALLDAGFFARQFAQVEQASTANLATLGYLDIYDVGRSIWKNTLNTNAIRNFTYGEGFGRSRTFDLNYITTEGLDTLLVTFNDFIIHNDVVSCSESRHLPSWGQLFMHKLDSIHGAKFE